MAKLSRFPKMVMLQYYRAKALDHPEDIAKAIGYAQAKKYAIFKNVGGRRKGRGTKSQNTPQGSNQQNNNHIEMNKIFRITIDTRYNLPVLAGKIVKPEEFDNYFRSFDKEILNKLHTWAKNIIDNTDVNNLIVESRFFNNVWKTVRDQEID